MMLWNWQWVAMNQWEQVVQLLPSGVLRALGLGGLVVQSLPSASVSLSLPCVTSLALAAFGPTVGQLTAGVGAVGQ